MRKPQPYDLSLAYCPDKSNGRQKMGNRRLDRSRSDYCDCNFKFN
nr:MAG TPA: hypothetical protein [Caudoviricetes sp.]